MAFKMRLDCGFGKVINFIHLINIVWLVREGSFQVCPTDTNRSNASLFKYFLRAGCIFISKENGRRYLIDLGVFFSQTLEILCLLNLNIITLLAYGCVLRTNSQIFACITFIAGWRAFLHLSKNKIIIKIYSHLIQTASSYRFRQVCYCLSLSFAIMVQSRLKQYLLLMSKTSTPRRIEQQDLSSKEYKLYDVELFKSQLKVFQSVAQQPQQADEKIKIQEDQSLNMGQHFPISYEEGKKDPNNFSVSHSFDGINEEGLPSDKKVSINQQSKGKLSQQPNIVERQTVYSVQDWENRPRKCSNPMFEANKTEAESQLVRQLEILTKERSRYKETNYFSKKQRSVEVRSIQDLFEAYKHSQPKHSESNLHNRFAATSSDKRRVRKQSNDISEKKDCQLCEKTKERVQKHLHQKQSKYIANQGVVQQFVPQKWVVGKQPKIKKANMSPERSSVVKYLVEEEKDQYKSEHSKNIFSGQVPHKQEYLQQNKLREQYLRNAKQRSQEIHKQLQKLKYPPKFNEMSPPNRSSSRKKIFAFSRSPSLHKPQEISIVPVTPKTTKHSNENNQSTYRSIFTSKVEKEKQNSNKKENHSVDFNYVKQALVHTRIHIFNSKSKEKEKAQKKSNSKVKIFKRISPKHTSPSKKDKSPIKKDIIHNFNVMEMSYETREWFQKNEKEILIQSQKIFSYQLITRYIGQSEIKVRLGQFIKGMIEPKRWILLMVDGVYARLKDRYLPQ